MIARLKGEIEDTGDGWAVIDVGGVGYMLFCSARTLAALPARGMAARVEVETHVREDHIHLYGFATAHERDWFRLLTTVQGVGARVALAILSALAPDALTRAIAAQDKAALTAAAGVGGKLAARILTELKDKAAAVAPAIAVHVTGAGDAPGDGPGDTNASEAISALVNLGFGRSEAFGAVHQAVQKMDAATVEALIPAALKELRA